MSRRAKKPTRKSAFTAGPVIAERIRPRPAGRTLKKRWPSGGDLALIGAGLLLAAVATFFFVSRSAGVTPPPASSTAAYVGSDLHSIVVDPSNPLHLYVGGHQAASESRDGGRTFSRVPALDNADPMAWMISADGQMEVTSGHYGLRASHDGGKTWSDVTSRLPGSDIHSLGVDPRDPTKWWAYLLGRGVYESQDAGNTWNFRGGSNLSFMGPILVLPSGALLAPEMQKGLVRSTDEGRTWAAYGSHPFAFLAADPTSSLHLFAAQGSISESLDGGASWRQLPGGPLAQAIAVGSDGSLYAADLVGGQVNVYRTADGGQVWSLTSAR